MQRRIREEKRKALESRPMGKNNQQDGWKSLTLAEVQASDLDGMDLTDLPSDLLKYPEGEGVDYTKSEEKMAQELFERQAGSKKQ